MGASILAIDYFLPEETLTNADLSAQFPEWKIEKIRGKTGIDTRHIAGEGVCSSDLAVAAAEKLLAGGATRREDVDFLLLCTQTPDYFLPTTACLLQDRLGLPTHAGALDFNLGCSGYIYGLGLAKGLVETGQASRVLLVTAETYSKLIHPGDRGARTIFGDGAAATLIGQDEAGLGSIGPFQYGTDGGGGANLVVPAGGMRKPRSADTALVRTDSGGNRRSEDNLFMNGPEIFTFTLKMVPALVAGLLSRAQISIEDVDLVVFHQASGFMLDHLRSKLGIPSEKFFVALEETGNTVSSTIPIALSQAASRGVLRPGQLVLAAGFGVGYSWGATLIRWPGSIAS